MDWDLVIDGRPYRVRRHAIDTLEDALAMGSDRFQFTDSDGRAWQIRLGAGSTVVWAEVLVTSPERLPV